MIQTIIKIFTDPTQAFNEVKKSNRIWPILLIMVAITMGMSLISFFDGTSAESIYLTNQTLDPTYTYEAAESQAQIILIIAIVIIPISLALIAFIYHIGAMFQGKTGYKKSFQIILYANLISILGQIISFILGKTTGLVLQYNALMFLDATTLHPILVGFLQLLDIFVIWRFFVIFTGFKVIHDMTNKEAGITASLPLIYVLLLNIISSYALMAIS